MAQYSRATLTDAGVIIARRMMDDDSLHLTFTGIASGDGQYSAGESLAAKTALKSQKQFFPLSSKRVTEDQTVQLKYVLSNINPDGTPLTVGYYVREVGIFAQVGSEAAVLYAIAVADEGTADYLPEYNELQPSTITMDWFLTVANTDNISIAASTTAYALATDLAETNAEVATKLTAQGGDASAVVIDTVTASTASYPAVAEGDTLSEAAGKVNKSVSDLNSNKLNKTGDAADAVIGSATESTASYPVPAAGDTFKVILGKIIKFLSDIKAAYTNVSVSGKTVTFTTAAGGTKQITTQDTTYGLASTSANGLLRQLDSNTSHYMRGDGTWQTPPNTTYSDFTGATASAAGAHGLVPAPAAGRNTYYLRGDQSWQSPQNNATTTAAGYVLDARMGKTLNDKIDVIGNIFTGSMSSAKSCSANTWTAVASVTVSAGAYILFGRARCATGNANKMFSVIIGYGGTVGMMSSSMPVTIGTIGFSASTSDTFVVNSTTTFSVSVFPNATMTIDAANITAIRIK